MEEGRPSATAMISAMLRAAPLLLDDDPKILGAEEANARYFAGRMDGLRTPPHLHLMKARVGSGS